MSVESTHSPSALDRVGRTVGGADFTVGLMASWVR